MSDLFDDIQRTYAGIKNGSFDRLWLFCFESPNHARSWFRYGREKSTSQSGSYVPGFLVLNLDSVYSLKVESIYRINSSIQETET